MYPFHYRHESRVPLQHEEPTSVTLFPNIRLDLTWENSAYLDWLASVRDLLERGVVFAQPAFR